jgi:hypothetical protein
MSIYKHLLTYEEFVKYYFKYKRFPDFSYNNPNKVLNEKQLLSKYNKYVKWFENKKKKKEEDIKKIKSKKIIYESDKKMQECKVLCMKRADYKCEIWEVLTAEEKNLVKPRIFKKLKELDPIHVISRSQSKKLYYNPENIIIGQRYFHSLIDSYKDPITLKNMTIQQRSNWFIRVIGKERWNYLQKNK